MDKLPPEPPDATTDRPAPNANADGSSTDLIPPQPLKLIAGSKKSGTGAQSEPAKPKAGATPIPPEAGEDKKKRKLEEEAAARRINALGRPPKVKSPKHFEQLANAYVADCQLCHHPITWTGMALYMGFSGREAMNEMGRRVGFGDVVKRAHGLVERAYEDRLYTDKNPAGAIFALKQFGWKDKQDIEFKGIMANVDLNKLPDEAIDRMLNGEHPLAVLEDMQRRRLLAPAMIEVPTAHKRDSVKLGEVDK